MSLHSSLRRGAAPARPARITIRRRLLGRSSRLRTLGMAAGLISLGLATIQSVHAATYSWDGMPGDWFSNPSNWTLNGLPAGYPGAGDDARNFTTAAMTLGQSTTVNSFLSDGAFTLNGGTFSGNQANAASTLQVNNVFTLNGGTINNFTVQAGVQQTGQPAPSVVATSSGGNVINNSIVNANLDLFTNSGAFLDVLGATTANGMISLANGSNLRLRNDGTALTLGSAGVLQGAGTINQFGSTSFINNGTVNANSMGNTLSLALTNFNSSGLMEATNGGILSLQNTNTNNSGAVSATNGGIVSITGTFTGTGTAAQGNLITASSGGQVQVNGATLLGTINTDAATALVFNGSGGNIFNGVTSNANLDLSTVPGAFLDVLGATTESGTITLANGGNLRLRNDGTALTLGSAGVLQGAGTFNQFGSTAFINNGTLNANLPTNAAGNTLTTTLTSFTNNGLTEATNGGILSLQNATTTNSGSLVASGGGVINLASTTFQSNAAGSINTAGGTFNVQGTTVQGTVNGVGASSLIFNSQGGNIFNGVTSNINLDLFTNAGAFLDVLGATTESGTITLANGGNLRLRNDGTALTLGSAGVLQGSGTFNQFGSTAFINNGTLNANLAGQTLTTALTGFTNNGLTEATNGGILSLQNATTTNSGSLVASGGGVINLASTTFQGNAAGSINTVGGMGVTGGTFNVQGTTVQGTVNGVGASSLIFNSQGGNIFNGVTSNINLDLFTNAGAFLDITAASTESGTITLAGSGNLRLRNDGTALTLAGGGLLQGAGTFNQFGSTAFINNGTVNANLPTNAAGNTLTTTLTNFTNNGLTEATNGGILSLQNATTTNSGSLVASGGGVINLASTTFQGNAAGSINTVGGMGVTGGTFNVQGTTLLGTINGVGASSLVFNSQGGNILDGTTTTTNPSGVTSNINLDLASNGNAFLDVLGTATESGTITLAGSGNLRLRNDGTALTLGSGGLLQGAGTFNQFGSTAFINNGTVNANLAGQTLTTALTSFTNNGLTEATNGATLSLQNTNTNNNAGSTLAAMGPGSLVTIQGTFTGAGNNLITASGGGQVQVNGATLLGTINTDAATALVFNGSGGNIIDGGNSAGGVANINANLDLASNGSAFVDVLGAATESGTITLAGGGNLRLRNDNTALTLGSGGVLQGSGTLNQFGSTTLNNGGTVSANTSGQTLNINTSNFNNTGTATAVTGATLSVTSNTTNSGTVNVAQGGTASFSNGLTQTAGATRVFGTLNASETVNGGLFGGNGQVVGNIVNTGGTVQSVNNNTGGSLNISGNFSQGAGGTLDVFFGNSGNTLLTVTGQTTLAGTLSAFDLEPTPYTKTGVPFAFLDYSGTLAATGTSGGFTQYFSNEVPIDNNTGLISGASGFQYELINDTKDDMLDLEVMTPGAPVPEASTTVSLGLLLALGLGGMVIAAKRKKKA